MVMLLMSSVGGIPGLTDPLVSRPNRQFPLPTIEMGFGVGGVAVAGRTRNGELMTTGPLLMPLSRGLKLPCE